MPNDEQTVPALGREAHERGLVWVELVGREVYDRMVTQLERADWVPVEHPTVRLGDIGRS